MTRRSLDREILALAVPAFATLIAEPMLVLETALPIKFAETIVEALGHAPERPAKFLGIEDLPKRVQVMPANVEQVKAYIAQHCD